jgi:gliding motility-associated lipoprotein GldH
VIKWTPILALLFLLTACEESVLYTETVEIDSDFWTYDNPVSFSINATDTSLVNELQLIIEHSQEYAYENLYIKVFTQFPDGKTREERLSINLADKKGKWIGNCRGDNCKLKVYLMEHFKFPQPGNYKFTFEQNSRIEKLNAIKSLQLKMIPVKKEDFTAQ